MPKDPTKNLDRYKIRGEKLNEFDFHQNQEELAQKPQKPGDKTATKSTKASKSAKKSPTRKAAKK